MFTYSEAMSPLDVHSDTDKVEFNSVNDVDTNSDSEDIEVNRGNNVRTNRDADGVEFNHGNGVCSEQGKENSDGYKCINDVTDDDDDVRDMEFNTEEEATEFYVMFARCHGFAVRKDEVKRDSNENIIMRQLVCNKEGVNYEKKRMAADLGQPFELTVVRNFE